MILKVLPSCILVMSVMISSMTDLAAQKDEWESVKMKKKQQVIDSTLTHLDKRWEIKLNYGAYYFANHAKSNAPEEQYFSGPMRTWQLTGVWHFSERLFADLSIGFQQNKFTPSPDVRSAINGDDIELEGFGLVILPLELGLKYYLTQNRFRPYIGLGGGVNAAIWRHTLIEGNTVDGITRTDSELNDSVIFARASTGFDFRLGIRTSFTLNTSFYTSNQFTAPIGGYKSYEGFSVNAGLALIL